MNDTPNIHEYFDPKASPKILEGFYPTVGGSLGCIPLTNIPEDFNSKLNDTEIK